MAVTATVVDQGPASLRGLFNEMWLVSATVDPASVAAEATGSDSVTATGVQLGDMVIAFAPGVAITDNLAVQCFVSAANTIKIQYSNNNAAAGAAIDLASSTWRFLVARPRNSGQAS